MHPRYWKEEPQTVPKYQGNAFPGMCTQIGEILSGAKTFHTSLEHCFCTGGVVATGVAPPVPEEQKKELIEVHNSISKGYKDIETALCYENEMAKRIPLVKDKNAAVQVALLRDIDEPYLVLIFCTPGAADILNRTYCYVTGEPIHGFGGNGGCPALRPAPMLPRRAPCSELPYVAGLPQRCRVRVPRWTDHWPPPTEEQWPSAWDAGRPATASRQSWPTPHAPWRP